MKKFILLLILSFSIMLSCGGENDKNTCKDSSECEENYYCNENQVCSNTCENNEDCLSNYCNLDGVCAENPCDSITCSIHLKKECVIDTDGEAECNCISGYHMENNSCVDTDECMVMSRACPENTEYSLCINYEGTHECVDKDECEYNNGNCGDLNLYECINNEFAPVTCIEKQ